MSNARFEYQKKDDHRIWKIYGTDYKEMTKKILAAADLAARIGDHGKRIGIKPNLVVASPAEFGGTTHPQVVAGIIEYLQERDFRNLVIAEGSWVGDRTSEAFEYCGYNRLSGEYGVPLVDTQKQKWHEVDCAGMKLNITNVVDEIDFLINVPVMKGHCQTGMTCALKNMKGCIPGGEKRRFHRMGLHEPIGHLSAGIRQDFILADAICPDLNFEDGGNPVALNRLILARDPVLLDAFSLRQIGLEDGSVPYIRIAERSGVGSADLSKARITTLMEKTVQGECVYLESGGEWSSLPWHGERDRILKVKEMVCDVDSCSACYGTLIPVLHRLEEEGLASALPGQLCIGQGFRGRTGRIGIGNCTARFDTFLKGCPPDECQIEQFLRSLMT
jgi:uncharacterized protein (DUF362 family)